MFSLAGFSVVIVCDCFQMALLAMIRVNAMFNTVFKIIINAGLPGVR
jgi:hypothetical protein